MYDQGDYNFERITFKFSYFVTVLPCHMAFVCPYLLQTYLYSLALENIVGACGTVTSVRQLLMTADSLRAD